MKKKRFNLFKQEPLIFTEVESYEVEFVNENKPQKVQLLKTLSKTRQVKPKKGEWEVTEEYWELNGDYLFSVER